MKVYDPYTYFRYGPHISTWVRQDDYPGEKWLRYTNELGMREDAELSDQRPDLSILVAGDSHTEGVCSNDLSFSNQLEAKLRQSLSPKTVEVLNTGCSSYNFYNYLGVLEKFESRRPDVFIVAVFGGNDFVEALPLFNYFHRAEGAPPVRDEWNKQGVFQDIGEAAMAQGLTSIGYFSRFPEQVANAIQASLECCGEIQKKCKAMNTALMVLYIPAVFDLGGTEASDKLAQARAALKLTSEDLAVGNQLGDLFLRRLSEMGIETIDLRQHFDANAGPWYWSDYHINLKAQAKIADLLFNVWSTRLRTDPRVDAAPVTSPGR